MLPGSRMFIPNIVPIRLAINNPEMTITSPMNPVVIFFCALDTACLSPPALIIPIAPVIKRKINHIPAAIVIIAITVETSLLMLSPAVPEKKAVLLKAFLILPPDIDNVILRKLRPEYFYVKYRTGISKQEPRYNRTYYICSYNND